jgi:hypothetical protein
MIISVGQRTAFLAKIAVETGIEIAHWRILSECGLTPQ